MLGIIRWCLPYVLEGRDSRFDFGGYLVRA